NRDEFGWPLCPFEWPLLPGNSGNAHKFARICNRGAIMTEHLSTPVVPAGDLPDEIWPDDLWRVGQTPVGWLWHGYLKPGAVTLLTSRWKSGKTTLLSVLLSRLASGGELAGRAVAAGKAVVVSEESPEQWASRGRQLDFGRHVCWLCRPFR